MFVIVELLPPTKKNLLPAAAAGLTRTPSPSSSLALPSSCESLLLLERAYASSPSESAWPDSSPGGSPSPSDAADCSVPSASESSAWRKRALDHV